MSLDLATAVDCFVSVSWISFRHFRQIDFQLFLASRELQFSERTPIPTDGEGLSRWSCAKLWFTRPNLDAASEPRKTRCQTFSLFKIDLPSDIHFSNAESQCKNYQHVKVTVQSTQIINSSRHACRHLCFSVLHNVQDC